MALINHIYLKANDAHGRVNVAQKRASRHLLNEKISTRITDAENSDSLAFRRRIKIQRAPVPSRLLHSNLLPSDTDSPNNLIADYRTALRLTSKKDFA